MKKEYIKPTMEVENINLGNLMSFMSEDDLEDLDMFSKREPAEHYDDTWDLDNEEGDKYAW